MCDFCHGALAIGFELQDKPDIVAGVPRRYVHMEMENRLTCNASVIGKNVEPLKLEALHQGPCNNLRYVKDVVKILFRKRQQIGTVRFRNDQRVAMMDRMNVEYGDDPVTLKEDLGRERMTDDIAERAIHASIGIICHRRAPVNMRTERCGRKDGRAHQ